MTRHSAQMFAKKGFTLVELLIVIVVIAILAGIVIISYSGWHKNIVTSQMKNDLSGVSSAMESARSFGSGYPTSVTLPIDITSVLTTFTPSSGDQLKLAVGSNGTAYCIDETNTSEASLTFFIDSLTKTATAGSCLTRTDVPAPTTPAGLAVTAETATTISFSWTASTYATTYALRCGTDPGVIYDVQTATVNGVTVGTVSSLVAQTNYYCEVQASNASGTSSWSSAISQTTTIGAPSGLAVATASTSSINYSFSSVANAVSYNVQKSPHADFSSFTTHTQSTLTGTFTGMAAGTPYYFRVQAVDANSVTGPWSATATGATLPSGLVGWWPLDGSAIDASGNGNNGTILSATATTGQNGQTNGAYSFNGTSSQITIPDSASLSPTSAITISAWVYATSISSGWQGIVSKDISSGISNPPYALEFATNGTLTLRTANASNISGIVGCTDVTPVGNTWYYVAGVFNGTTLSMYVNNTLCSTTVSQTDIADTTGLLRIGQQKDTLARWFNGTIDDVRVYNVALSQTAIQAVYGAGAQ